jgi:YaiO family outer membrane protein
MNKIATIIVFTLLVLDCFSQSTESSYEQVKQLAKEKKYDQAEKLCKEILAKTDDGDVRFYLGLIYSWSGRYDDARNEFKKLEQTRPNSLELTNAQYNVEYWSGDYSAAITILDKSISKNPNELDLLIKKAKMLNNLGKRKEASATIEKVLDKDPASLEARLVYAQIKNSNTQNTISANFTYDFFSDSTNPWYFSYLQYSRKTSIGTVIGRVNYANRFNSDGFQVEADSYLSFWKGGYTYANIGFSGSSIFPDFRCGLEYYHNLPHSFEASLGFRYMKFSSSDVLLYTGTVGKYYKSYWFSIRPQFRFRNGDVSYSFKLASRRYFSDPETYIGVEVNFGTAPDFDHQNIDYSYLARLKSWGTKIVYSQRLGQLWVISSKVGFDRNEIIKNSYRNQYTLDVTIAKSF